MRPGLFMVIDPQPGEAVRRVAGMPAMSGDARPAHVPAACGDDWAAWAVAPPADVPGCGADVHAEGGDILIWTGDLLLPDAWPGTSPDLPPARGASLRFLAQLRRDGLSCLEEIDGSFCGAWYDGVADRWSVFNDRLGLLPVFWTHVAGRLIVGPQAATVWRAGGQPLKPDGDGVIDVLRAMNVTCDRTLIDGVHWLEGGHVLQWKGPAHCGRTVRQYRYWEYQPKETFAGDPSAAIEAYVAAFEQSIRRHTDGVEPLMLGISGGIDSRLILALCYEMDRLPYCFSAGFPHSPDARYGRRLAYAAGASHAFVRFPSHDVIPRLERMIVASDGLHGATHLINSLPILPYLAKYRGAVLLEGHVHGIAGGGAVPTDDDLDTKFPPYESRWARKHCHAGGEATLINRLLHPDLAERSYARWCAQIQERYARCPSNDPMVKAEFTVINGRSGRNDVLGPALWREDVLLRSPATDRRMLDWCAAVPGRWRRGKALYLDILRRRFPRFARVQRTDASGLPISNNRILREFSWQYEKVYHAWARLRYGEYRRWGRSGHFMSKWLWNHWRDRGLTRIREPGARVLQWVDRQALDDLWSHADRDIACARPLMTMGALETMLRALEEPAAAGPAERLPAEAFLRIERTPHRKRGSAVVR